MGKVVVLTFKSEEDAKKYMDTALGHKLFWDLNGLIEVACPEDEG